MSDLRIEERWAAAAITAALGVPVTQHDDGSYAGMYDLDIGDFAAAEVTAATDPESVALWKLVNGPNEHWTEPALTGGWIVKVEPSARAKRLRKALPPLLQRWELLGVTHYRDEGWDAPTVDQNAASLGVRSASHNSTSDFPGSIYILLEQPMEISSGFVADTGDGLSQWVSRWAGEPDQADNLRKLAASDRPERHLFVIIPGLTTAPFSAADVLLHHESTALPSEPPDIPVPLTHLWVATTWAVPFGLRYSPGSGWEWFRQHPSPPFRDEGHTPFPGR